MNVDQNQIDDEEKAARLERLSRRSREYDQHQGVAGYTKFVRMMRVALPLCAVMLIAVLYLRSGLEEQVIMPMEEATKAPSLKDRSISKNELLNPKFESVDNQNQPYKITAKRAVQGEVNENLIMLEHPSGVITMEDGGKITMQSKTGAYRQDTERFFLEGDVFLEHEEGYKLQTEEAHIDLKQGFAWSEKDVNGEGPDMSIAAKGVHANSNTGEIIFAGPAKLTFNSSLGNSSPGNNNLEGDK